MAHLAYYVIHCTDTPEGRLVTKEDILRWHTSPVEKGGTGWSKPGYSDMIDLGGKLINLVPYDENDNVDPWEVTNGAHGINALARHCVYVGGKDASNKLPKDTRNSVQLATMEAEIKRTIRLHPTILVLGHYQSPNANGKLCPCFDVPAYLHSIGVADRNIYGSAGQMKIVVNNSK